MEDHADLHGYEHEYMSRALYGVERLVEAEHNGPSDVYLLSYTAVGFLDSPRLLFVLRVHVHLARPSPTVARLGRAAWRLSPPFARARKQRRASDLIVARNLLPIRCRRQAELARRRRTRCGWFGRRRR